MLVKSKKIYSSQSYCDEFFRICPVFNGDKDELRKLLNKNGFATLQDYSLDEIEQIVEKKIPVVLVDTTYIDDKTNEMVNEYRWFQVPADCFKQNQTRA